MIKVIRRETRTPILVEGEYQERARFLFSCDNDDVKPSLAYKGILIAQASYCIDVDSYKRYIYNEETGGWSEISNGSGSNITVDDAPTQGSNNPVKSGGVYSALQALEGYAVTFTGTYDDQTQTYSWTCDKTYDEICAAVSAGKFVYAYNSTFDGYLFLSKCDGVSAEFGHVVVAETLTGKGISNVYYSVFSDDTVSVFSEITGIATSDELNALKQRVAALEQAAGTAAETT